MTEPAARTGPRVSPEAMQRARESYERCCAEDGFLRDFYRIFLANCPEAGPMFARTNLDRQARLLQHAIGLLLIYPGQPPGEPNLLDRVAERHSRRDLAVAPALYQPFVDSLVETARLCDPHFTPDVAEAWRATLAEGVSYMKSKY